MNASRISLLILLALIIVHGGAFLLRKRCAPIVSRSNPSFLVPDEVQRDAHLIPPRRVVATHPSNHPVSPRARLELPPTVAWVFGGRMDWRRVTMENLRWIPGVSRSMATRLIRIRDLYDITDFRQLTRFPHVGGKTIQRLMTSCFIPHAA